MLQILWHIPTQLYAVQSLSSETERIVTVWCIRAHRWRRGAVPCQLVSRPSKGQLSAELWSLL